MQEQVEVVVQSLGTDNIYPKMGQTVRVHYTCRVSLKQWRNAGACERSKEVAGGHGTVF